MAEVQGGRNFPSSERKARHNKVYTAKGPRDRRVRLSADTAIQFYDVQDRLGYERASEAVDWLIKKAKSSIDKLFDMTSSSQNSGLLGHPDPRAESNSLVDYIGENNMLEKEDFNLTDDSVHTSEYNSMQSSMLFPYIQAGNCSTELGSSYNQQVFEKGQIQKTIMFNCKFDHQQTFMLNSTPFLLQPPGINLTSVECPGSLDEASVIQSRVSSDEIVKFYISGQGYGGHQEQTLLFNQPAFVIPATHHE